MKGRVKVDWASLSLSREGDVIVCAKYNGTLHCMRFDSLGQLKQAMVGKRMRVKKWVVAVPRSLCILKPLTLPASDLSEAAKMVEFELPSLVPLPMDEIVYGCTLLNKRDNMVNVLLCILKLKTLNVHLKPYTAVGVEPHRIVLDSLAIQNWFNITSGTTSGSIISALANKHCCNVLTSVDGNLQKANELSVSNRDVTASSREIMQEVLRQQEELAASLNNGESRVLLAGAKEYVSELEHLFRIIPSNSAVGYEVATVPNPRVTYYAGDGKREHDGDTLSCEAIVAAGLLELATASGLPHSNLLPRQYAKRRQQKALLFNYVLTGFLSLLLILSSWSCLIVVNWRVERMSRTIKSQIAPIEHIASSVESKRQRVKAIQKQLSNRGQISQIVEELYRYTPDAISISELRFTSKHNGASVELRGQADQLSNAFEYTDAMSKADLLDGIQIVNAQQIPRPGGSVVEFKAHCFIQDD